MPSRTLRFSAAIAFLSAFLGVAFRIARARTGTDWFPDDAYYYAVIARNLAATGRATFDGVTATNGFHPLLLWIEAAAYRLGGTSAGPATEYLVLVTAFGAAFLAACAAALVAAWRSGRDRVLGVAAFVVTVVATPRFAQIYLGGMESILVLPLLAAVLGFAFRRRYVAAGLCAVLLVFSRLDTLPFLVAPLALVCAVRERSLRPALWILAPAFVGVGGFMALNLRTFGHPLPISGSLKSTFPLVHFQPANFFGNAEERLGLRAAVLGALLGAGFLARRGRLADDVRFAGLVVAALAVGQAIVLALFEKWTKGTPTWYLAAMLPLGAAALALGLANLLGSRALGATVASASVLALALQLGWMSGHAGRLGPPLEPTLPTSAGGANSSRELIRRAIASPPGSVWASTDCGLWSFWSRRTFVNLDGLVNDFRYQDRLKSQELGRYLEERGVRYLVLGVWNTNDPGIDPIYRHRASPALFAGDYEQAAFFLWSYRYSAWSDTVRLPRRAEAWRSDPFQDGLHSARLVVFDLSRS